MTMSSSSWREERQGEVGDLSSKSKEQLHELLSRQNKLLSNKRFIQTLPDKGKKISDFAERVRLALAHHEEEERKQDLLLTVRTELQSKYQQALTQRQPALPGTSHQRRQDGDTAREKVQEMDVSPLSPRVLEVNGTDEQQVKTVLPKVSAVGTDPAGGDAGAPLNSHRTKEGDLVEALQRVSLSEHTSAASTDSPKDTLCNTASVFPRYGRQPLKKPHYIEVLEKTEKNVFTARHKFKPNQLVSKTNGSHSSSPSPSPSPGGYAPISAEARKERDKKHIDDITAARLPPLHHSPAMLLSLEESADLQCEQTRKYKELQANMAAQKLSEGLGLSMGSYNPEGGPLDAYREVHDQSSEED